MPSEHVVLVSLPAVREQDLVHLPTLAAWRDGGAMARLRPGFPAVTCTVQANMTTGLPPREHGIIANGLYDRASGRAEMWTSPNTVIERPQLWEVLEQDARARDATWTSAVWFPMHTKQTKAHFACTPAPIHNPDGSESLWCYTKPTELYGELRDRLGHFPLQHYWGPMTNIKASAWIIESAVFAAASWRPNLFYIYLPHLDYEAQRHGPDSPQAIAALRECNTLLERLRDGMRDAYAVDPTWIVAGEYAITAVDRVGYPNRMLREAGLLAVTEREDGEHLDTKTSAAWAMVDHQVTHVFVNDPAQIDRAAGLFRQSPGVAEVLVGPERAKYALDHPRSGEIVLVAERNAWFAYYWWNDDAKAPGFARTVDIHRKPGYDPVELFFDPATRSIPLDARLVRGSHGAPVVDEDQQSVLVVSDAGLLAGRKSVCDQDVFSVVQEAVLR